MLAMNKTDRNKGSSIQRTLRLLEAVANAERPMTATELNEQLEWPKATIHRLCTTLERQGYVQRLPDRNRLISGPKLHELAIGVIAGSAYRSHRHAVLESFPKKLMRRAIFHCLTAMPCCILIVLKRIGRYACS